MAHTVFVDGSTVTANRIVAAWLNDADTVTYVRFGDGTSYTGNLTVPGTTSLTGTLTAAAINASGLVAMAGAATVGTTLGVTGAATFSAGITGSTTLTLSRAGNLNLVTKGYFSSTYDTGTLWQWGPGTVSTGNNFGFTAAAANVLDLLQTQVRSYVAVQMDSTLGVTGIITASSGVNATGQNASTRNIDATGTAGQQRIRAYDTTTGSAFLETWNNGGTNALTLGVDNNAGALTGTANQNFMYGSGSLKIYVSNGTLATTIASTGVTIPGTLGVSTGMAVGGATPGAGGIAFPATAVAVADANTLDDYEEGTFTPTFTSLTVVGTPTYSGRYTKIGRLVNWSLRVQATTSTSSTAGATYAQGFPFVCATAENTVVSAINNGTLATLGNGAIAYSAGSTTLYAPTWTAIADVALSGFYIV